MIKFLGNNSIYLGLLCNSKWCNQIFLHRDAMGTLVKVISEIPENHGLKVTLIKRVLSTHRFDFTVYSKTMPL